jgi:hypothetical protein
MAFTSTSWLERKASGMGRPWANKKYHGYRILPDTIMNDLDEAGIL